MQGTNVGRAAGLTCLVVALLLGCAAIRNAQAMETERVLAASGFKMKFADTSEKLAHLETLTQQKLVAHPHDGAVRYVYADATSCKCLYVGDEAAYQRFQQLAIQQNIADEQREDAAIAEDASMRWGLWGGWNGGF